MPGGRMLKPVLVSAATPDSEITVSVTPLVSSEMTVSAPAAPEIRTTPVNGVTMLGSREIATRGTRQSRPGARNVPGINQVSEGHASVPAVRGLARGRTLFLIDGGRVTSERRVGPSGTFLDPSVIEGIDIARGPGSVAYGSDALGGVVSVRTRRAEPGSPFKARFTGTLGGGVPEARGAVEVSKGFAGGGVLVQAHVRTRKTTTAPTGEVFNSGGRTRGSW